MPFPQTSSPGLKTDCLEDSLASQEQRIGDRHFHRFSIHQPAIPRNDHRHLFSHRLSPQQALNFLAHFHLAKPTDGSRVGALLGDFVKGTPENLLRSFPEELVEGIMLHRAIDQFTDSHALFRECKRLLHPSRKRFSGIVLDLFFDHLLSRNWTQFSTMALTDFIAGIHHTLEQKEDWLPSESKAIVKRMKTQQWLSSYQNLSGLSLTLARVSQRRSYLAPLKGAESDLSANMDNFQSAFDRFYPELIAFANQVKEGGAFNSR